MAKPPNGPLKGTTGARSRTAASQAAKKRRQDYISNLLAEGKTVRQIAALCDVSVKQAHDDIQDVLSAIPTGDVAAQRRLALNRLDDLETRLRAQLDDDVEQTFDSDGNPVEVFDADGNPVKLRRTIDRTVSSLLRVEERRAKLLGLDSPVKIEATVSQVNVRVYGAGAEGV